MTPEEMVRDAVANAALDGRTVDAEWQAVLLRVASGELSGDDAMGIARQRDGEQRDAIRAARWVAQEVFARDLAAKDAVIAEAVECAPRLPQPLGEAVIGLFRAVRPFQAGDGNKSWPVLTEHCPELVGLARAVVEVAKPAGAS